MTLCSMQSLLMHMAAGTRASSGYPKNVCKTAPCRYTNPDGSTRLVNHAPWLSMVMYNLNAHSRAEIAFPSFALASYLASDQVSSQLLLDPYTG